MNDLQEIQNKLKEISELLQTDSKKAKRKAAVRLKEIATISTTMAFSLEIGK